MFQKFLYDVKKIKNEECELDQKCHSVRSLLCDELDESKSRANEIILGGKEKLKTVYFVVLNQLRQKLEMVSNFF